MQLKNNFTEDTRNLYLYKYDCDNCNRSDRGLEGHHLTGRNSNSPLNFSLACTVCHRGYNHNEEEEGQLFIKNLNYLKEIHYQLTEDDMKFLVDNPRLLKYYDNYYSNGRA